MHSIRIALTAALLALPAVTEAGGIFLFKGGALRLADDSQTLDLAPRNLDEESMGTLALSIEARKKNGVAFGAEFVTYRNEFTPPTAPGPGEARTRVLQFVGKKYFSPTDVFHPYFGAGIGVGNTEVTFTSGGVSFSDEEFTLALQAVVGFELRFDNLSFVLEAKHLYHDIEGGGNEFDPTSTGAFVGLGFNW
jgi:hypothetical protein